MKIEFQGRVYNYELDALTVKQSVKIEKHIGGTLLDWEEGMSRASALCLQALGWMILHDGDNTPIDDVDFPVMKLAAAWAAASEAETAAEAAALAGGEPDPSSSPSPLPEASQASHVPAPPASYPAS